MTDDPSLTKGGRRTSAAPSFIDVFSGAGGLSLGLSQAGWSGLLGLDSWSDAVATYNANLDHPGVVTDLTSPADVRRALRQVPAKPDWVVGGPPCQGYSTVGKRIREDGRNKLFLAFRDFVGTTRPDGFVLENVLGMRDMRFIDAVEAAFEELGFAVSSMVLRAADHGVPQLRRRVIFVGHRERGFFAGPEPTHTEDYYVSVIEAIGDLPPLRPGQATTQYQEPPQNEYQAEMRTGSTQLQGHIAARHPAYLVEAISHISDGGNRQEIPDHLQPRSGFHNSYSRLASWTPAVAVTQNMSKPSGTRCIHPFQHRGLTTREGARLQSFPDVFHFTGGQVSQRLQVANAVPPRLAAALAAALESEQRWTSTPTSDSDALASA